MHPRILLTMSALLAVAGCNQTASAPDLSLPAGSALASHASSNSHLVTGGGQIVGADFKETYGITARIDALGNVSGQVEMHIAGLPAIHGSVTCLAVDGSSAWIGGSIRQSQDESVVPVGVEYWFRVQDNGNGPDPLDRISSIRLGPPAVTCNEQRPVAVPWPLERGNITVR